MGNQPTYSEGVQEPGNSADDYSVLVSIETAWGEYDPPAFTDLVIPGFWGKFTFPPVKDGEEYNWSYELDGDDFLKAPTDRPIEEKLIFHFSDGMVEDSSFSFSVTRKDKLMYQRKSSDRGKFHSVINRHLAMGRAAQVQHRSRVAANRGLTVDQVGPVEDWGDLYRARLPEGFRFVSKQS